MASAALDTSPRVRVRGVTAVQSLREACDSDSTPVVFVSSRSTKRDGLAAAFALLVETLLMTSVAALGLLWGGFVAGVVFVLPTGPVVAITTGSLAAVLFFWLVALERS